MTQLKERIHLKPRPVPTDCPNGVRIATMQDRKELFEMMMTGVVPEMAIAPVNELRVAQLVNEVLRPAHSEFPRPVVAVMDGPDGKIAGAAPIIPKQWWYSDEFHLIQPWVYVRPENRKGPYARTLIETVTWWSDKIGLPMVMITSSSKEMMPRREIYSRYAKPFGGSFIHQFGGHTNRPENVRIATMDDFWECRELALMLNEENANASLNTQKMDEVLMAGLGQQHGIMPVVMDESGKIVGSACLLLDQWDYSQAWHYSEVWVYVRPENRNSKFNADLIDFGKWFSEQTGILLTIGITSKHRAAAKMRLYSRQLTGIEVFFLHEVSKPTSN